MSEVPRPLINTGGRRREDAHLKQLLEGAAEEGAMRALKRIGLEDETAVHDVHDLRNLLRSYRAMQSTVWSTVVKWLTTVILVAITAAVASQYWDRK